jgi:hypothetical protein
MQVLAHYWKTGLYRVPEALPSAIYQGTRQSNILPSVTLGKILHTAKTNLAFTECQALNKA